MSSRHHILSLLNTSFTLLLYTMCDALIMGGGHSHWNLPLSQPLFLGQSMLFSLLIYHQCAVHVPPFLSFGNFCIFSLVLAKNFSSLDPHFSKFSFPRPSFFQEDPLFRPYFWKPVCYTPTKKSWVSPPPPPRALISNDKIKVLIDN